MCNIKDVCCNLVSVNWSIASWMSSKLEPVIWLRVLVTLAYMKGRTDVRTYVRTYGRSWRHGYKTKFSHIDGLPYFLKYGAPARARLRRARSSAKIFADWSISLKFDRMITNEWRKNQKFTSTSTFRYVGKSRYTSHQRFKNVTKIEIIPMKIISTKTWSEKLKK